MRRRTSIHSRIANILEKEWRPEEEVLADLAIDTEEDEPSEEGLV
jgi:DNA sulfur modification protein DndC